MTGTPLLPFPRLWPTLLAAVEPLDSEVVHLAEARFVAGHGRQPGGVGVQAPPHHHVGEVHPGRLDPDPDFARTGFEIGLLLFDEGGRATQLIHDHSVHQAAVCPQKPESPSEFPKPSVLLI